MGKDTQEIMEYEWSHMFNVSELDGKEHKLSISPSEEQVALLLKRFGIDGLSNTSANFKIKQQGQTVHVIGHVKATVTQPCVVRLELVDTDIEDEFEAWYADPEAAVSITKARRDRQMKKGQAEVPMLEEHEDPDPIVDGQIDLGELAAQYISLSINPYVQAEGVEFEHGDDTVKQATSETRKNPFAALADWKDKLK